MIRLFLVLSIAGAVVYANRERIDREQLPVPSARELGALAAEALAQLDEGFAGRGR